MNPLKIFFWDSLVKIIGQCDLNTSYVLVFLVCFFLGMFLDIYSYFGKLLRLFPALLGGRIFTFYLF